MNFLSRRGPLVTDSHVDVTGLLRNTITTPFCARSKTLEDRPLFNINRLDFQFVDVCTIVMLGIRNRGLEHFLNDNSTFFRAEC